MKRNLIALVSQGQSVGLRDHILPSIASMTEAQAMAWYQTINAMVQDATRNGERRIQRRGF